MSSELEVDSPDDEQVRRDRRTGILLTVLLVLALAGAVLIALALTWVYVSLGWPRTGLLSLATLLIVVAWAPIVGLAMAAGRHDQQWWTPYRLAVGIASTLGCVVVVMVLLGVAAPA
ncbi:MAG: hypothetical protein U0S36_10465 [Candidatus Nanopelagicales bacterium]